MRPGKSIMDTDCTAGVVSWRLGRSHSRPLGCRVFIVGTAALNETEMSDRPDGVVVNERPVWTNIRCDSPVVNRA